MATFLLRSPTYRFLPPRVFLGCCKSQRFSHDLQYFLPCQPLYLFGAAKKVQVLL